VSIFDFQMLHMNLLHILKTSTFPALVPVELIDVCVCVCACVSVCVNDAGVECSILHQGC